MIQAKGREYTLAELLADDVLAARLTGGAYMTIYLSPRDYHRVHAPVSGRVVGYDYLPGALWPVKPKNPQGPLNVQGAPPILLVGGTNDPATPYIDAQSVNRQISGSVLLTRQGNGHTSYDSSACAHAAEDAYLINLTLPAAGATCSS